MEPDKVRLSELRFQRVRRAYRRERRKDQGAIASAAVLHYINKFTFVSIAARHDARVRTVVVQPQRQPRTIRAIGGQVGRLRVNRIVEWNAREIKVCRGVYGAGRQEKPAAQYPLRRR